MTKRFVFSDIICLYIAIICQLYARFYQNILHYSSIAIVGNIATIVYQYVVVELFLLCVVKPIGSVVQENFQLELYSKENRFYAILIGVILLYIVFVVLMQLHILPESIMMSPIRFIVYAIFGIIGFFIGLYT